MRALRRSATGTAPTIAVSGAPASATTGFVLVAVLCGLLVVGSVAFAMVFSASLDSLAVKARQTSVIAREELEGALALAAAAAKLAYDSGEGPPFAPPARFGPWPQLGVNVTVLVEELTGDGASDGEGVVVRLTARSENDDLRHPEVMIVQLHPSLVLLRR